MIIRVRNISDPPEREPNRKGILRFSAILLNSAHDEIINEKITNQNDIITYVLIT